VESAEMSAEQHPGGKWYTYAGANDEDSVSFFCGAVGWEGIAIYGKAFTYALFLTS